MLDLRLVFLKVVLPLPQMGIQAQKARVCPPVVSAFWSCLFSVLVSQLLRLRAPHKAAFQKTPESYLILPMIFSRGRMEGFSSLMMGMMPRYRS